MSVLHPDLESEDPRLATCSLLLYTFTSWWRRRTPTRFFVSVFIRTGRSDEMSMSDQEKKKDESIGHMRRVTDSWRLFISTFIYRLASTVDTPKSTRRLENLLHLRSLKKRLVIRDGWPLIRDPPCYITEDIWMMYVNLGTSFSKIFVRHFTGT